MKRWIEMVMLIAVAGMLWACDDWPQECPPGYRDGDPICDGNQLYWCYWHEYHGQATRTEAKFELDCSEVGATCDYGYCIVEDKECPPHSEEDAGSNGVYYFCENNISFSCYDRDRDGDDDAVIYHENCESRICDPSSRGCLWN